MDADTTFRVLHPANDDSHSDGDTEMARPELSIRVWSVNLRSRCGDRGALVKEAPPSGRRRTPPCRAAHTNVDSRGDVAHEGKPGCNDTDSHGGHDKIIERRRCDEFVDDLVARPNAARSADLHKSPRRDMFRAVHGSLSPPGEADPSRSQPRVEDRSCHSPPPRCHSAAHHERRICRSGVFPGRLPTAHASRDLYRLTRLRRERLPGNMRQSGTTVTPRSSEFYAPIRPCPAVPNDPGWLR